MIADDDIGILDAIRIILEDEGYQIETTTDGNALREIEDKLPDLLLLDVWMSGSDGRDLCRYLKRQPETCNMPVILISATTEVENMASQCGADDYMLKPFDLDELLDKVKKYLETKD